MVEFCLIVDVFTNSLLAGCSGEADVPQAERMIMTVAEIVKTLIEAQQEGRDVNLNK